MTQVSEGLFPCFSYSQQQEKEDYATAQTSYAMSSMPWGAVTNDWKRRLKEAAGRPQQVGSVVDAQGWISEWSMAGYGCAASGQPQEPSVLFAPGSALPRHTSGRNSLEFTARYPTCDTCRVSVHWPSCNPLSLYPSSTGLSEAGDELCYRRCPAIQLTQINL